MPTGISHGYSSGPLLDGGTCIKQLKYPLAGGDGTGEAGDHKTEQSHWHLKESEDEKEGDKLSGSEAAPNNEPDTESEGERLLDSSKAL